MSGCASVQLGGAKSEAEQEVARADARQRANLHSALDRLEDRPWTAPEGEADGFVTLLFGGKPTSPRHQAESYLASLDGNEAVTVRRDLENSLAAVWHVASTGQAATSAMEPVPSDLRVIEDAIVQARLCRLVYAEALMMLAKDDESVSREEVRSVKKKFNQAIRELGRTADSLSNRLENTKPKSAFAGAPAAL